MEQPFDEQVKLWHEYDFSIRFRLVEQLIKHGFPVKTIDRLDKSVRVPMHVPTRIK